MSRVGKKPIPIPEKTKITLEGNRIIVEGVKGKLSRNVPPLVETRIEDGVIRIIRLQDDRTGNAMQGLARSLFANMVKGVSVGFERTLEINGIGYRADLQGNRIVLNLGYSHPINYELPDGISAKVDKNNIIKLSGIDKELLGHTAASIRRLRSPEPYKGKGIKYAEEHIQKKAGKSGTK